MNRMFKNMVYNDTQNMFFDDSKIEKFSLLTLTVALATYVVLQLYYCTVALATYVITFIREYVVFGLLYRNIISDDTGTSTECKSNTIMINILLNSFP